MAQALGHKWGQIIGDLLEEATKGDLTVLTRNNEFFIRNFQMFEESHGKL